MIKDYLIVAYLTAIACWPVTLTLIGVSAWIAFYTRRRMTGVILAVLFVLVAVAAWQFEHYM
ncbi:hypothetical protein FE839_00115 [Klebsiella indica]|uniref:Uncharacterized protein n=1 Tax=Klebsiella indica TaxID=2582917 RepID=A0A5R9LPJ8_9ENTR|nr:MULTISPECIES: hypothetical protein [Klebsiella]TLV23831.1 hypothetical protein FE839_00115 [Klebsiella indica]